MSELTLQAGIYITFFLLTIVTFKKILGSFSIHETYLKTLEHFYMLWQHIFFYYRSKTDGSSATEGESEEKESESNQMSVEDIESAMQQMFDEIKRKRENDFAILEEVKKEIIAQVLVMSSQQYFLL